MAFLTTKLKKKSSLLITDYSKLDNQKYIYIFCSPESVTATMVNHESWENVVLAAPVMAVLLNQTLPPDIYATVNSQNNKINETVKQEKTKDVRK